MATKKEAPDYKKLFVEYILEHGEHAREKGGLTTADSHPIIGDAYREAWSLRIMTWVIVQAVGTMDKKVADLVPLWTEQAWIDAYNWMTGFMPDDVACHNRYEMFAKPEYILGGYHNISSDVVKDVLREMLVHLPDTITTPVIISIAKHRLGVADVEAK
jgi:hypothetical protein